MCDYPLERVTLTGSLIPGNMCDYPLERVTLTGDIAILMTSNIIIPFIHIDKFF